MQRHDSPDSSPSYPEAYPKFIAQNPHVVVFEQLSNERLAKLGFRRVDQLIRLPSEQYEAILEEMAQFMKVTTLTSSEVPALPKGWSVHIGNSLATSAHTGKSVTHGELSATHKALSQAVGLSRSDKYADSDYVAYWGDVPEKLFPLHTLTWIILEHDGQYSPFNSLEISKTNSELGLVFRTVFLYQQYAKELLSRLFNSHVAPKIFQILDDIWVNQPGLLFRRPTILDLHLTAEEIISYMTYGYDSKSILSLVRGPRSNPTEHWHTLIPQFRRRIIRLVTNRNDTTALSEDEKNRYFQILDKLNAISPLFGKLRVKDRSELSSGEQIKMIDESGQAQSALLSPEVSPIHGQVSELLINTFSSERIKVETSDISASADEVQAKHMQVLKITAMGIESWKIVSALLPIFVEYDSIKRTIAELYVDYLSTNSSDRLRLYLDDHGLSSLTNWLLTKPPTKPMVDQFGSDYQKQKQLHRETRITLTQIIRNDYICKDQERVVFDLSTHQLNLLAKQIVEEKSNSFPNVSEQNLEKICRKILKAEMYIGNHSPDNKLSQIHQLVEYSLQGLSQPKNNSNFLLPLGLIISTQDFATEEGETESVVKITISGNDSAGLEKIWGLVAQRGLK